MAVAEPQEITEEQKFDLFANDWPWKIPLLKKDGAIVAYTMVDPIDYEVLRQHTWRLQGNGYAVRKQDKRTILLHRVITDAPAEREVDHMNRHKLDNRRCNLRLVTSAENSANVPSQGKTSEYRGVFWYARDGRWSAQCKVAGKRHHLGYFDDELEAAEVAREFRRLNLPGALD